MQMLEECEEVTDVFLEAHIPAMRNIYYWVVTKNELHTYALTLERTHLA